MVIGIRLDDITHHSLDSGSSSSRSVHAYWARNDAKFCDDVTNVLRRLSRFVPRRYNNRAIQGQGRCTGSNSARDVKNTM